MPFSRLSKGQRQISALCRLRRPQPGILTTAIMMMRLLFPVNEAVSFDYSLMSGLQEIDVMDHTNVASVGKDVYGEHYPILIPDHGLFIAGIVHDIAPGARIECVRVLNSLCVGDLKKLTHALERIYDRMSDKHGDLFRKRVVINLSLVIPRP